MADLNDHTNHSWNPGYVKSLYPHPSSKEILNLPISKTGTRFDQLVWKHSSSGVYQVKKAYNLLSKETALPGSNLWQLIWKVKVPLKICNFM